MEYSTMSYTAAIALGRAIRYINTLDLNQVSAHNAALAAQLADGLAGRGAKLISRADPARRAGTVTARFPGHDGEAIAAELTRRGVIVSPGSGLLGFPCTSTTAATISAARSLSWTRCCGDHPGTTSPDRGNSQNTAG
jgi:cysteine desulfurase / selenocysteine lyase